MGLFNRKKSGQGSVRAAHNPLSVLGWHEVRLFDPTISPQGMVTAQKIAATVAEKLDDWLEPTLDQPEVDALLRTLIPGLKPLGGFPENPDALAIDFATGWCVAEMEEARSHAFPGMISKAAQMALSLLRTPPDSEHFAPASWAFLDLGYSTKRLELEPDEALARVYAATER